MCSVKRETVRPLGQNEERIGKPKPAWRSALLRTPEVSVHHTDIIAETLCVCVCVCVCVSAFQAEANRSNIYPATFST